MEMEQAKMKDREFQVKVASGDGHGGASFQIPLHYPRYKKEDYERMESRVDMLLVQYGLACKGSVEEKRAYAMGAFLWPDQL